MRDQLAEDALTAADDSAIHAILEQVCSVTHMGFAALARVTEQRWIACQVVDRIEFGLDAGDELAIKTTICDEIRRAGRRIIIDDVGGDPTWRMHPVPMLYGFESYAALPITLADGSFFGTICSLDPAPREVSAPDTVAMLERSAARVAALLSRPVVRAPVVGASARA